MAEQLAGDVEKAVKMVQGLTTAGGEVPKGTERMPRG